MRTTSIVAGVAAGGYTAFAVLWHVSANHIGDEHAVVRALAKGICLVAAGLLFLAVSVRLTTLPPRRGVLPGALWSAGAVAVAGLGIALFDGWRTDWGDACNQCDPKLSVITLPMLGGGLGLVASLVVGWLTLGVRCAIGRRA